MSIPQDQMAQMQQQFMQSQGGSPQQPPMDDMGQQAPPEDAGVAPYPDQFSLDSPEGQQMLQQAQEPEDRSLEDTIQALNNFLYETITNKKLDLKVQVDGIKGLSDSLVSLLTVMKDDGMAGEEQRAQELHGLDLEHRMMMNKLEAKGKVDDISRAQELHNLDISHKQETHAKNIQQMEQKREIEAVNTHQNLQHSEAKHEADLEATKRKSLESSSKASQSE